jgi:hypothetical protein
MNRLTLAPLPFAIAITLAGVAHAEVQFASQHANGLCLSSSPSGSAVLAVCGQPDTQFAFDGYGMIGVKVGNAYRCLTSAGKDQDLRFGPCNASAATRWALVNDGSNANANLRSEQGWCADIRREARSQGAPVQAYDCGAVSHRKWTQRGSVTKEPGTQVATKPLPGDSLPPELKKHLPAIEQILKSGRVVDIPEIQSTMVAAGAGNLSFSDVATMVAAGAGNMVAAGAGNMVAAGAGNLGPQAASIVAAGGGNLQVKFGAGMVAAGAGNLVAAGAGNVKSLVDAAKVIQANSNLGAQGINAMVAAGAGNLTAQQIMPMVAAGGGNFAGDIKPLVTANAASALSLTGVSSLVTHGAVPLVSQNPGFAQPLIASFASRGLLSVPDSGWCKDSGFVAVYRELVGRDPANTTECDPNTYKSGAWQNNAAVRDAFLRAVNDGAKLQKLSNMLLGRWEGFKTGQPIATTTPVSPTPPVTQPVTPQPPTGAAGTYSVVSTYANKCLAPAAGSGMLIWDCVSNPNQAFERTAIGQLKQNGQCLGNNGNTLALQACGGSGALHQLWVIDGGILKNKNQPALCLDIEGGGRNNGSRVLAWSCHGGANQKWVLRAR